MGLFGGKTTTKTDKTTMPVAPDYVQQPLESLYGNVNSLSGVDPHSLVSGFDPLQQQASASAAGLTGNPGNTQMAGDWIRQVAGGSVGGGGAGAGQWGDVNKYLDPSLNFELNSSLNSFDQNAAQQRTQQGLGLAGRRGGSGADIATSLLGGQQSLARGQLQSGILSHAWDAATPLANAQAERDNQANMQGNALASQERMADASNKLQAAGLFSNIGNNADANDRANIALQSDIGGINRGVTQEGLNAPTDYLAKLAAIMGGLPGQLVTGEHTTGTNTSSSGGGLLSKIGQGLGIAAQGAALFSDERLKRDIERVGTRPDGLGVYLYRYLWSPVLHLGVMAQEVLRVKPEAVIRHPSGFLMVDYARL